jgi:hypothetical protein
MIHLCDSSLWIDKEKLNCVRLVREALNEQLIGYKGRCSVGEKNNVIPFLTKKESVYHEGASITLDRDIVNFLEIMTFEERNQFLNEVMDFFFDYVKKDEDEIQ